MGPQVYYNENDPKAAAWIRELVKDGLIPKGIVDERSIVEVQPNDLRGYDQCHFFAGIAGWALALRSAGWPENRQVWTGSCPCQPFSAAGKRMGQKDSRHLWPQFRRLIRQCRPPEVFGEQVASKDGRIWLSGVFADLEALGYRAAGTDLCAAGLNAPHIRQRLFWVANSNSSGSQSRGSTPETDRHGSSTVTDGSPERLANTSDVRGAQHGDESRGWGPSEPGNAAKRPGPSGVADTEDANRRIEQSTGGARLGRGGLAGSGTSGGMGHTQSGRQPERWHEAQPGSSGHTDSANESGAWSDFDVLPCLDGNARRVESGTFPLVARLPKGMVYSSDPSVPINPQATAEGRVMRLRGYGNSIVPQVAAEFIQAYMTI